MRRNQLGVKGKMKDLKLLKKQQKRTVKKPLRAVAGATGLRTASGVIITIKAKLKEHPPGSQLNQLLISLIVSKV